jgi:hypothetical protein
LSSHNLKATPLKSCLKTSTKRWCKSTWSAQIERIIETNLKIKMKMVAHSSQIQELDKDSNPRVSKRKSRKDTYINWKVVASRRIWLLNVQSSKICQIRNSLQSSKEINFVTIVSRDHISQGIVRKMKESCAE